MSILLMEDAKSILTILHERLLKLEMQGRFDVLSDHGGDSESETSADEVQEAHDETLTSKLPIIRILRVPPKNWTPLNTLPAQNEYYDKKLKKTIYEDWTLSLKLRYINLKRAETTHVLMSQGGAGVAPLGLHVFENKDIKFSKTFFEELEELYRNTPDDIMRDRGDDGRASNLIFHSSKQTSVPCNYALNMPILHRHAREVGRIMELYAQGVKHVLNATDHQLDECSMSIIRYDVGCGIRQHIDNIAGSLGYQVGPLVSIAVGDGEKYLDLLPTITNDRRLQPVRVTVNQGDVIIMDGPARLEWSHSVPVGHKNIMYSLLLKFKTLNKIPAYKNKYLDEMMYYSIDP